MKIGTHKQWKQTQQVELYTLVHKHTHIYASAIIIKEKDIAMRVAGTGGVLERVAGRG